MPVMSMTSRNLGSPKLSLKSASDEVDLQLGHDRQNADFGTQLNSSSASGRLFEEIISGKNDFDYPPVLGIQSALYPGLPSSPLYTVKRVPLPEELFEQFEYAQANVTMGFFAEISRAWLAIDSDIYVWNFEDGSDVAYFDALDEVILTAGLVSPKQGVFQEHIKFLLCLTTPFNIVVLGVSFADDKGGKLYGEMHLQPQPLFMVPTDSVFMSSVAGLWNGRIFFSGTDGCLYELAYQAKSSWFSQKCKKINHSASWASVLVPQFLSKVFTTEDPICQIAVDNTRNILYGRTESGSIQVYYAGLDGSEMHLVTSLSSTSIASCLKINVNKRDIKKVIHIAPISKAESVGVHLVAITEMGLRLYFSTTSASQINETPSSLRLVHVRFPPGFTPSGSTGKPSKVHQAFYRQGVTLMIENVTEENDKLWCLSQESFPFQSSVKESQVDFNIEGKTWCVTEIPDNSNSSHIPEVFFTCLWPESAAIVNQHVFPQRRFALLSSKGSHVVSAHRPFEQLRNFLIASGCGISDAIESFFKFYGVIQSYAMCLILICQSPESEKEIVNWAVQAFFKYDAQSVSATQSQTVPSRGYTANVADVNTSVSDSSFLFGGPAPAGSSHGSYLASPIPKRQEPQTYGSPFNTSTPAVGQSTLPSNVFSGRHSGIALYLARILRPVWNHPLVFIHYPNESTQQLMSRLSSDDLTWFIESLRKLRDFMERYSKIDAFRSPVGAKSKLLAQGTALGQRSSGEQEAIAVEGQYLLNLSNLIRMCCEVLELWRTLCDNQMHILTSSLTMELREQFLGFSFKDFVLNGQEISAALIGCLMTRYLDDQATVDAMNTHLREICPTLFSADDAVYSKANEMVHFARHVIDPSERKSLLDEAIKMYIKIPNLLDLSWICEQLQTVRHFEGIIELALCVASKTDPHGVGLHYYKSGKPRDDMQGKEAYLLRCQTYKSILNAFDELYDKSSDQPHPLPTEPGPPAQPDPNALTADQAKHLFEQTLLASLQSDDELFHVTLYNWMMAKDLTERLLKISSPFLEQFIITTAAEKHPNDMPVLDLLWKYYQMRKQFIFAAKVLMGLAERECASINIEERVAYISRGIMCAKNALTMSGSHLENEFLHELEDKLEVARIQYQIHQSLATTNVPRSLISEKTNALKILDSKLIDISQLYGDFADKFDLIDCKLGILLCAGHQDENLVENIWKQLIDKAIRKSDSLTAVSQSLLATGRIYINSPGYFPIDFLMFYLEKVSCENNWDPTWVFVTMKEIGVNVRQLWLSYDKLIRTKDATWQACGKPLHLFKVISLFIKTYLEDTAVVPAMERLTFSRTLCESSSGYLVELESMNESDPLVRKLISRFRGIIAELKREF